MRARIGSGARLIPPPEVVRTELARSVRESIRLRSLLRISEQSASDRRFIQSLTERFNKPRPEADGRGVSR